jgi:cell division control protein 24
MADPLSIAASVAGLLAVAGKISNVVSGFATSVADAPESAQQTAMACEEIRLVLLSLQQLMEKLAGLPRERKEMIQFKHLVVVFRQSILTFSELEALTNRTAGRSILSATAWMAHEKPILELLSRMESHKSSFLLLLNILQW